MDNEFSGKIRSKLFHDFDFSADNINSIDDNKAKQIAILFIDQALKKSENRKLFLNVLEHFNMIQERKTYNIIEFNNNGRYTINTLENSTYNEAIKYVKYDVIGSKYLKYYQQEDNIFVHIYNDDTSIGYEITESED